MIRQSPTIANDFKSGFFSYEKDIELIVKKLFTENKHYSDNLKRLLIINQPDCLTANNAKYDEIVKSYSVKRLKDEGYLRFVPRLDLKEHEDIKSFIIITVDDFTRSLNTEYRNCSVSFFIFSEYEHTAMDNYQYRPIKIAGYIDGIMDGAKLTNIGKLEFIGAQQVPLNEYWGGIMLMYAATHEEQEDKNPDIPEDK